VAGRKGIGTDFVSVLARRRLIADDIAGTLDGVGVANQIRAADSERRSIPSGSGFVAVEQNAVIRFPYDEYVRGLTRTKTARFALSCSRNRRIGELLQCDTALTAAHRDGVLRVVVRPPGVASLCDRDRFPCDFYPTLVCRSVLAGGWVVGIVLLLMAGPSKAEKKGYHDF
jgi:hypothetical protein